MLHFPLRYHFCVHISHCLGSRLIAIKESQHLFLGKLHVPALPTVGVSQVLRGSALSYEGTRPPEDCISQPWALLFVCVLWQPSDKCYPPASSWLWRSPSRGQLLSEVWNIFSSAAGSWGGRVWAGRGLSFLSGTDDSGLGKWPRWDLGWFHHSATMPSDPNETSTASQTRSPLKRQTARKLTCAHCYILNG